MFVEQPVNLKPGQSEDWVSCPGALWVGVSDIKGGLEVEFLLSNPHHGDLSFSCLLFSLTSPALSRYLVIIEDTPNHDLLCTRHFVNINSLNSH